MIFQFCSIHVSQVWRLGPLDLRHSIVTVFYALYHVTTAKTQPVDLIENTFRREEVLYLACNEDRTFFASEEHKKYNFINKGIDFIDLPSIFRVYTQTTISSRHILI